MLDECFANPRLAALYDTVDGERDDLDHYEAIIAEFGASAVVDVGCGTGELACRLAAGDFDVVGVDPAEASLEVAMAKPLADRVRWIHGVSSDLPPLGADLATMTGNVAQVFLSEDDWQANLAGIAGSLRSDGLLVFETRDPAVRAWDRWTFDQTFMTVDAAGGVDYWIEVLDDTLPYVTFRAHYRFHQNDEVLTSDSTLWFRPRDEVGASLGRAGFKVLDIRDAPDRPGREFVFVAQLSGAV